MTSNSTGEYLRLHAEIESEGATVASVASEAATEAALLPWVEGAPLDFDKAVDDLVTKITIGPHMTVDGISRLCAWFSTPGREVFARIECVGGKPVAYLVRGTHEDFPPAFLRKQALDMPNWRREQLAEKYAPRDDGYDHRSEREIGADIYCQPDRLFR